VSEVVEGNGILAAHYEYAPFGMFAVQKGIDASRNPWCFSSEYLDCEIMMLYYNFRYNNLLNNFWSSRDITGEKFDNNLYRYVDNQPIYAIDVLGNHKLGGPTVSEVKWVQRESDPRAFILEVKAKGIEPGCELNFIQLFKRNDGVDFPNWRVDNISTSGGPNPEDMYYYDTFDYRQKRFYHKDGTVEFYDKPGTDDLEFFLFIVQRCCLEYYGGKKECHCCKRSRATILGRLHWKTLSTPSQNNLYVALSEKLSSQEKQFADSLLKKLLKNGGVQNDCKKYRKDHPNDPVLVTSIELQFN
jgi:RHS repeat-associated protein